MLEADASYPFQKTGQTDRGHRALLAAFPFWEVRPTTHSLVVDFDEVYVLPNLHSDRLSLIHLY